ncbi:MAG: DUF3516 domain-containing protein [Acidobacteriota bacterium]
MTTDPESPSDAATDATRPTLGSLVPDVPLHDADPILDNFLSWAIDAGFTLYDAQEEAILELMAGRHVILNTPTGSGKSMVALALHYKALCEGRRCFYTSPIKALASEKFFSLCDELGAERVGMQTGDASINPHAPIICCTAEVLANGALRQGPGVEADYVVMDEFHYYADRDRGVAWQIPLITLPDTQFLLMSATLGNTAPIAERLEAFTGRRVHLTYSDQRPVPLEYEYRDRTSLIETIQDLLDQGQAPIYVVNFTQRECAELAQGLTSLKLTDKQGRAKIRELIADYPFDTPYGRECKRFLSFAVGVHHAGLLPKYRLLTEQLAQQGLLKVIAGTDTLGVGVNIPIRTVLFTKLAKFDGEKVSLLSVRDFKQIAGRAGRKGFDDRGWVVCQAPAHVVEAGRGKKAAKGRKGKGRGGGGGRRGEVSWNRDTFEKLVTRPPETLKSRFRITHGMVINTLQRDAELDDPKRDNFLTLRELITRSHETDARQSRHLRSAAVLVRSLGRSGVLTLEKDTHTEYRWVVVNSDLQWDFSLHQTLSLYLVEAIEDLDPEHEDYALDVLSLLEAILEDPRAVLRQQEWKRKQDAITQMKAEGYDYEERTERLEQIGPPMPPDSSLDFLYRTFADFRHIHPWVAGEALRPKAIARELYEQYMGFENFVRLYKLQRSEGVLLRYLSQVYKTLDQTVPTQAKTDAVWDVQGFFRAMLERVDTSLIDEWENLLDPELHRDRVAEARAKQALRAHELFDDPKAFNARIRAEMHNTVAALAELDYEEAARWIRTADPDGGAPWNAERLAILLADYYEHYERIVFDHGARQADRTRIVGTGARTWDVTQVLVDPEGDNHWHLAGIIDFSAGQSLEGPLVALRHIGT